MQLIIHNLQAFYQGANLPPSFRSGTGGAVMPNQEAINEFVAGFKTNASKALGTSENQIFILALQVQDTSIAVMTRRMAAAAAAAAAATVAQSQAGRDGRAGAVQGGAEPVFRTWNRRQLDEVVPRSGISLLVRRSQATVPELYGSSRSYEDVARELGDLERQALSAARRMAITVGSTLAVTFNVLEIRPLSSPPPPPRQPPAPPGVNAPPAPPPRPPSWPSLRFSSLASSIGATSLYRLTATSTSPPASLPSPPTPPSPRVSPSPRPVPAPPPPSTKPATLLVNRIIGQGIMGTTRPVVWFDDPDFESLREDGSTLNLIWPDALTCPYLNECGDCGTGWSATSPFQVYIYFRDPIQITAIEIRELQNPAVQMIALLPWPAVDISDALPARPGFLGDPVYEDDGAIRPCPTSLLLQLPANRSGITQAVKRGGSQAALPKVLKATAAGGVFINLWPQQEGDLQSIVESVRFSGRVLYPNDPDMYDQLAVQAKK